MRCRLCSYLQRFRVTAFGKGFRRCANRRRSAKDDLNLYTYVGNDPLDRTDPSGNCADHYKDGTCQVNVDPSTGAAGAAAGKQLEGVLNKYDKAVNALANKDKFNIKDSKGNVVGSMTGTVRKIIRETRNVA